MTEDFHLGATGVSLDINPIRVETALSRFPIHNLSKGKIAIDIKTKDSSLVWSVSPSERHGHPGSMAYKLDTLVVHRRIEEAGKPVPKLIKLGSLHEVALALGLGGSTSQVKRALRQNAHAGITCKLTYKSKDKSERTLEADFTRYSVIATGEKLPDGRKADAVYLVLNDIYMAILNDALTRPLDYDYLYALSPMEQRFYEIASYQIYPAVKYKQRAKLAYSEFCMLSTATRYYDFNQVKKQMYKIHRPHIESGYIEKGVQFEPVVDEEGQPDWLMCYVPGRKAIAEYHQLSFNFGPNPRQKKPAALPVPEKPNPSPEAHQTTSHPDTEQLTLEEPAEAVVRHFYEVFQKSGKTAHPTEKERNQAQDLLNRLGEEKVRFLITYAHQEAPKTQWKPKAFGGILHYEGPAMTAYDKQAQARSQEALQTAQNDHQARFGARYRNYLMETEKRLQEGHSELYERFETEGREERLRLSRIPAIANSSIGKKALETFDREEARLERLMKFCKDHAIPVLDFWEWDTQMNPEGFIKFHTPLSPKG